MKNNAKKTFQLEKILPKIQPALDAKNARQNELDNLKAMYQAAKNKVLTLNNEIAGLAYKNDEILKSSGSIDELDSRKLGDLKFQKIAVEEELVRIEKQLLPKARSDLSLASRSLAAKTQIEQAPYIRGAADLMSGCFAKGMDYFDEYIEATEAFYKKYGIEILPGTMQNVPRASENRLWQYIENGVLISPTQMQNT